MITITNGAATFTASADTLVQNTTNRLVLIQTDSNAEVWGKLHPDQWLEVPADKTIYIKSPFDDSATLATLEM